MNAAQIVLDLQIQELKLLKKESNWGAFISRLNYIQTGKVTGRQMVKIVKGLDRYPQVTAGKPGEIISFLDLTFPMSGN